MAVRQPLVNIAGTIQELPPGDTITGDIWTTIKKLADQTKTSTTTLAVDDTLFFTMAANTKYAVRLLAFFDTGATEDFKWRHVGPTSPTLVRLYRHQTAPGASSPNVGVDTAFSAADTAATGTGTIGGFLEIRGIVHNGANSGTFGLSWAQNTSGATATIVRAGAILEYLVI